MTSAPRAASVAPPRGAATKADSSTTRRPCRMPSTPRTYSNARLLDQTGAGLRRLRVQLPDALAALAVEVPLQVQRQLVEPDAVRDPPEAHVAPGAPGQRGRDLRAPRAQVALPQPLRVLERLRGGHELAPPRVAEPGAVRPLGTGPQQQPGAQAAGPAAAELEHDSETVGTAAARGSGRSSGHRIDNPDIVQSEATGAGSAPARSSN